MNSLIILGIYFSTYLLNMDTASKLNKSCTNSTNFHVGTLFGFATCTSHGLHVNQRSMWSPIILACLFLCLWNSSSVFLQLSGLCYLKVRGSLFCKISLNLDQSDTPSPASGYAVFFPEPSRSFVSFQHVGSLHNVYFSDYR